MRREGVGCGVRWGWLPRGSESVPCILLKENGGGGGDRFFTILTYEFQS